MNKNGENLQTLKDIVGVELFNRIIEELLGETIYIANYNGFTSKEERNDAIRKEFYHGLSVSELAEKYGMSICSIYKITEQK